SKKLPGQSLRQRQRRSGACSDKPVRKTRSRDCLEPIGYRLTDNLYTPLGLPGPQCGKRCSIELEIPRLHDDAAATVRDASAPALRQPGCLEDFGKGRWIKHGGEDAARIIVL